MRVVPDTPPKPGWMDHHLNWTVVIAEIALSIILTVIFFILIALVVTADVLLGGETEDSTFWMMMLLNAVIHLGIILPIAGWALRKKHRRLWWLLILFVPVAGWIVYLCLENRRGEIEAGTAGVIT